MLSEESSIQMFSRMNSENLTSSAEPLADKPVAPTVISGRRLAPSAMSLICGLVAFSSTVDLDQIRSIQKYCTTCWSNARLDPGVWEDCTQEVCVRLWGKMRDGLINWSGLLELSDAEESPEHRELIRVVDAVRKQAQRLKRFLPLEEVAHVGTTRRSESDPAESYALTDLLRTAREKVLTPRQDRIIELWTNGLGISEISHEIGLKVAQVSDEKYKAMCKLENFLAKYRDVFGFRQAAPQLA